MIDSCRFLDLCRVIMRYDADIIETRNSSHKPLDLLILLILNQSCSDDLADRVFFQVHRHYTGGYREILKENDPDKLQQVIRECGLAKTKAQYILNTLSYLDEKFSLELGMNFLDSMDDVLALKTLTSIKGIGVKSASCLLMFTKGRNVFPIDTHVSRIFRRIGILSEKVSIEAAHKKLQPFTPLGTAFPVHVALIELGRNVCQARRPECQQCYLFTLCDYAKKLD